MTKQRCLVLLGPTAVGKSSFLYDTLSPEDYYVISADSMQVYREFNVGTATPEPAVLDQVPHAGINEITPSEEYNVNRFLRLADAGLEQAEMMERMPVIVGGTGLYLKTFLYGMDEMPPANESFRQSLREEARKTSRQAIHDRLAEVDPKSAELIHPNDLKRTIRALEIYHETGQTKSELIEQQDDEPTIRSKIEPMVIGLTRPLDELRGRIRRRVENMLENGLVEEINRLREEWDVSETVRQAIGFSEVVKFIENGFDRDELINEMSDNTYQFARKQMTWFRQLPVDSWYHPDDDREELIDHIGSIFERTA